MNKQNWMAIEVVIIVRKMRSGHWQVIVNSLGHKKRFGSTVYLGPEGEAKRTAQGMKERMAQRDPTVTVTIKEEPDAR